MRTFTSNIFIISAQVVDTTITGTAIDGDIKVNFAAAATDVNQRLFVPESNLVVAGKFRLGKELATIGVWISKIIAVVSIPAPVTAEVEVVALEPVESTIIDDAKSIAVELAPATEVTETSVLLTPAQKRAATIAANKAKADSAIATC
ncbi:hypothetical protein [Chamaesiphon minutus]|uniref:Uncharacterized protein n=1 Tax=Chamaesiphon minutus (strain ATCC 27169 / PCC 6605) TaxID=1173020 RepID=K9US62_CHAP6|nr:hypothetical protein [Chamaesiphon minutus]AFY97109.1 hypothetical protein Cha6605_6283 [Chamaesiphon minutus PCC 6605]